MALVGAWLAMPGVAVAHPETSPLLVNRYVTAAVLGSTLEISTSLLMGEIPAGEERKRLDANGDGRLETGEVLRAQELWAADGSSLLDARLDGEHLILTPSVAVDLGGERTTNGALVIELRSSLPLALKRHEIRLGQGRDLAREGETELAAVLAPDWRLVSARRGGGEMLREPKALFSGPRINAQEDRTATFVIEPASPASPELDQARSSRLAGVMVALAAGGGLALFWLRRRRSARPR